MKMIVGLGNPGILYKNTRHNIGFYFLDSFCKNNNISMKNRKFFGNYSITTIKNTKVLFLKPLKYINLSGEVIKKYCDFYKISIDDILIIHDDMDIEVGNIKLKASGSSAGHNGLKNIELCLNTKDYKRLKIGISKNKLIESKDYVLGKYSEEEKNIFENLENTINDIILDFLDLDFNILMSKYNINR
ncbi:MAG: aminoacyl-tRNA hydrolase [Tenericutes bacterium]|nr:aminoacyl-tRNA hydrolase [Bacilli bacterium]MDD4624288.1 aminoacyl-tRNA hydrolase [Bacilli bacterium]NLV89931.1 aminoacyl-tRNA hydrolase [Mycoplasmatota bacterium]